MFDIIDDISQNSMLLCDDLFRLEMRDQYGDLEHGDFDNVFEELIEPFYDVKIKIEPDIKQDSSSASLVSSHNIFSN